MIQFIILLSVFLVIIFYVLIVPIKENKDEKTKYKLMTIYRNGKYEQFKHDSSILDFLKLEKELGNNTILINVFYITEEEFKSFK